jgi:hypothetical protein
MVTTVLLVELAPPRRFEGAWLPWFYRGLVLLAIHST